MEGKYLKHNFIVNTSLVRPNKRLGLVGLLSMLQDVAMSHANLFGFGYQQMLESQTYWVLTRQKLIMDSWPVWEEEISVKTWSRPLKGPRAYRDYEITREGVVIGRCSTSWVILDAATRRPKNPDFDFSGVARDDYALDFEPAKVGPFGSVRDLKTFEVRNSDLDMNYHVNNTKYAQWISDSIPFERHKEGTVREYEVNFLAETHLGDVITVQNAPESESEKFLELGFQGLRQGKGDIVFTARLLVEKEPLI